VTILNIAWKNLKERRLSSSLTAISVSLGVMLMVTVMVIYGLIEQTFNQQSIGYHLIVGPKGSPLQLVLSTVYHVNAPIENLPYRFYEEVKADPMVAQAVPVALGDTTEEGNFPIVGTVAEYFDVDYIPGKPFRVRGRFFDGPFEAVIGSRVAKENNWDLGSTLRLVHGGADVGHVHNERFEVVGVLAPTGTPNDKSVFINLPGFYAIEGHDKPLSEAIKREREFFGETALSAEEMSSEVVGIRKDHAQLPMVNGFREIPKVQRDVTSILVNTKTDLAAPLYAGAMKKGFKAMAVNPIQPMRVLLQDVLGNVRTVLLILTILILAVSGIGIFVSIYNSMSERRREIAIMRALGARRSTVFAIILGESLLLCLLGGLMGLALGHALVFVAAPVVEAKAGVILNPLSFDPWELLILPGLVVLGLIAGLIPGNAAYKTDVAGALAT
jgi:putative ABC transport system permease protein